MCIRLQVVRGEGNIMEMGNMNADRKRFLKCPTPYQPPSHLRMTRQINSPKQYKFFILRGGAESVKNMSLPLPYTTV